MKNKVNLIYYIGSLLGIFLLLSTIWIEPESDVITFFSYIPFIIWIIFLLFLVLEYICGKKPFVKTVFYMLVIFFMLILVDDEEFSTYGLNYYSFFLGIAGIPYLICYVVNLIKCGGASNQTIITTNNQLSVGVFHKNDNRYVIFTFLGIFVVTVIFCIICSAIGISTLYGLLLIPIYLIVFYLVLIYKVYSIKLLRVINKKLDINKFNEIADICLKQNLEAETRNYLLILKADYNLSNNKEDAIKLFDSTYRPNNPKYLVLYESLEVEVLILKRKFADAKTKLDLITNSNIKNVLTAYFRVFTTNEVIPEIEELYKVKSRIKFINIASSYIKMYYYESRNDHLKAKEYANKVLEFNSNLREFNESANQVLNDSYDLNNHFSKENYIDSISNEKSFDEINENTNDTESITEK